LKEGEQAPRFTGRLSTGEQVSLDDLIVTHAVVLFFYPRDFTVTCTKQVCAFRDNFSRVRDLDAVIFGVSSDGSLSHNRFIQRYSLPFPLINDTDRSIGRAYGVVRFGGLIPLSMRVTYVIDRQGIIRGVFHHELTVERHVVDVLKTLKGLRNR